MLEDVARKKEKGKKSKQRSESIRVGFNNESQFRISRKESKRLRHVRRNDNLLFAALSDCPCSSGALISRGAYARSRERAF